MHPFTYFLAAVTSVIILLTYTSEMAKCIDALVGAYTTE
jgi:hypothetical protein